MEGCGFIFKDRTPITYVVFGLLISLKYNFVFNFCFGPPVCLNRATFISHVSFFSSFWCFLFDYFVVKCVLFVVYFGSLFPDFG